ncbi:hypothetical protein PHISCL_00161 [Aspergillus sclerotialis]|uniref:F-box domain-containing protein n=1 Tax=Aspergillus sclerotialis TaxID=2070753 RepID=A0A3A3AC55_9EURO|nr:hypothetical protein PHISCL_00161 [Aspergillus sclerotialis]
MEEVMYRRERVRAPFTLSEFYYGDAIPAEIWMLIAERVTTKRSLRSLCETSRRLHSLCTKVLFRRIKFTDLKKIISSEFLSFLELPYLHYVRHLVVGVGNVEREFREEIPAIEVARVYRVCNDRLAAAVRAMAYLQSFSYGDSNDTGIEAVGFFNATLLNDRVIELKQSAGLRNVSMVIPYNVAMANPIHPEEWMRYIEGTPVIDLGGFRGLRTLSLVGMSYSHPDTLVPQLVSTLCASPPAHKPRAGHMPGL